MIDTIMESAATDPIKYPTVRLADPDVEYPLRYRHKDIVELWDKYQIDITQPVTNIQAIKRLPTIVYAGLAHLGTVTLEQVQTHLDSLDYGELSIYALAVMKAQKKVSPGAQAAALEIKALTEKKPDTAAIN